MTANPSHVPNSRPLAAASSGPGTRMQPSSALTTANTGAPQFPSGSIQDSTSSCETTRRTPNTTKSTSSTAASSASRMRVRHACRCCEIRREAGVGHGRGLHADDPHALARGEAGDRAEHGGAVVAGRVDDAAAQPAGPADDEAVGQRLEVAAEAVEPVHDRGDAIGLLHPQLLGAADDRLALREAAEQARRGAARRSRAGSPPPRRSCPAARSRGPRRPRPAPRAR